MKIMADGTQTRENQHAKNINITPEVFRNRFTEEEWKNMNAVQVNKELYKWAVEWFI